MFKGIEYRLYDGYTVIEVNGIRYWAYWFDGYSCGEYRVGQLDLIKMY